MPTLSDLPIELQTAILSETPWYCYSTAVLVCRLWYKIITRKEFRSKYPEYITLGDREDARTATLEYKLFVCEYEIGALRVQISNDVRAEHAHASRMRGHSGAEARLQLDKGHNGTLPPFNVFLRDAGLELKPPPEVTSSCPGCEKRWRLEDDVTVVRQIEGHIGASSSDFKGTSRWRPKHDAASTSGVVVYRVNDDTYKFLPLYPPNLEIDRLSYNISLTVKDDYESLYNKSRIKPGRPQTIESHAHSKRHKVFGELERPKYVTMEDYFAILERWFEYRLCEIPCPQCAWENYGIAKRKADYRRFEMLDAMI